MIEEKGVEFMEDNNKIISLTSSEFDYVSMTMNTLYNNLKKLPKRMRTPKFYLLENLVNNVFIKNE